MAFTVPAAVALRAQAPQPKFEVATVKPSKGPTGERGQPGGRYTATRTVKFFIADAFFFGTPLAGSRLPGSTRISTKSMARPPHHGSGRPTVRRARSS